MSSKYSFTRVFMLVSIICFDACAVAVRAIKFCSSTTACFTESTTNTAICWNADQLSTI